MILLAFTLLVLAMELYTGCALIGWSGDNMIVERQTRPGPYWFAIALHAAIGIGLPIAFIVSSR